MSKYKVPSPPSHLQTTKPTLSQHRETRRTLNGAFNEPVREYGKRVRVDNSAYNIGASDKSSIALRRGEAAIQDNEEASIWLKQHKWGLKSA